MRGMRACAAVAAVMASVVVASCGAASSPPTDASSSESTSSSASSSSSTSSAPQSDDAGETNGQRYGVHRTTGQGASEDGRGRWKITFGELSGGDPAVVEAFNGASHRTAMDQVEAAGEGANDGTATWTFESSGLVTFRSTAVAQVIIGTLFFGAHPSTQIGTVVIDSRSTEPIMLVDLFTDPQAGLSVLSEQAKAQLAADGLEVTADDPAVAPRPENFANWIPNDDGLEIHFQPYQFGSPLPIVVTVPWEALADSLAPAMAGIATR